MCSRLFRSDEQWKKKRRRNEVNFRECNEATTNGSEATDWLKGKSAEKQANKGKTERRPKVEGKNKHRKKNSVC